MKLSIFLLFLVTLSVSIPTYSAEEQKSEIDVLYEKLLNDNSKDAEKSYGLYLKSIDTANAKIIKSLESLKITLNDPKKGKLTIQERSAAINQIDEKIKLLKNGDLADFLVKKNSVNLLGENPDQLKNNEEVLIFLKTHPKWMRSDGHTIIFDENGFTTATGIRRDGKFVNGKFIASQDTVDFLKYNGKTKSVAWNNEGNIHTLTLLK